MREMKTPKMRDSRERKLAMHLGEELRYLILAIQREGNRQLAEALRPLSLTPSQAEVLQVLHSFQPLSLLELGARLVCESGSPSRLVSSMTESGWIEKLPSLNDGRAVLLRLTPKAEQIIPQLHQIEMQFNQSVESMTEPERLQRLVDDLWFLAQDSPNANALRTRKAGR